MPNKSRVQDPDFIWLGIVDAFQEERNVCNDYLTNVNNLTSRSNFVGSPEYS